MSKKNLGKHGLTTSQSKARTLHAMSIGAAGALVGASLALGVTPGGTPLAHADATPTTPTPATQPQAQKPDAPKAGEAKAAAANGVKADNTQKKDAPAGAANVVKKASSDQGAQGSKGQSTSTANTAKSTLPVVNLVVKPDKGAVPGSDRAATNREATPNQGPQANPEITLSKETKDTLPNMYAWGKSDNTYIKDGQKQDVKFTLKPADGVAVTKVAIFPNDNIDIDSENGKKYIEYRSDNKDAHQSYSGEYSLVTNADGSAVLTMSTLFRDAKLNGGAAYAANRCIYVYGTKDGQEVLLYKTNIARAATLIPPKTAGSIVLRYDQKLEEKTIREKLQKALDAPTEAKDGKSLNDQIKDASKAKGVGVRTEESKPVVQKEDVPGNKILVTDHQAYNPDQVNSINTPTAKQGETVTAYKTGVVNLKTYLVSDLGYKSGELALTVARYDTRIDKPTVEDPDNVSQEVKADIKKKLARLNHVPEDKVTIGADGKFTISFDGVDAKDAPKIALRDLVLKKLEEKDITVPANDKATVVYNPLGYSNAELERIKQSILDANKKNTELGLTSTDQITLEYIKGDIVTSGHANQGISNGQQENKITVKIKTDKAYAEFTSDVKQNKLTRLVDIRKDYDVSWDKTKNKLDGRDSDEGLSWSNDAHTTIIYRYDPTAAKELKTDDIIKLLNATPKDKQAGLRDLTGGEALDHEDTNGKPRKSHMHYALQNDEPTGELSLGNMNGAYWIGNQKVSHSDEKLGDNLSEAGSYSWDTEAGPVKVAGKKGKIYKARLFVQPYAMSYYKDVYLEQGRNPGNTAKAINIIFVPQTNHKTKDLSNSIGEHKTESVEGKDVPTQSKYYNASGDKKEAYDKALQTAKTLYESVKDTDESKLTEDQKAQIDNATINLNKARAELDGPDTNKDGLDKSITDDGTPAEGQQATTGTKASDKYKNVTDPDFKDANGNADTKKNEDAKKAKEAYDKALEEANKIMGDANATQKAVDDAKAKLDAARAKLNDFTTNKDKLNAALAEHGQVKNGKTGSSTDITKADPAYQNATDDERKAYDEAVKKANELAQDPNASQKEVNAAIEALEAAKKALDAKATDKSKLAAAEKQSFDNPDANDTTKQSTFYKNAKAKADGNDQAATTAINNYDTALAKAREVLKNDKATQAEVDDAKKKLEAAEKALHENYKSDDNDLTKALADNVTGYLMPAYFNAFDKAQAGDNDAKKAFKDYNDAYQKAKALKEKFAKTNPAEQPTATDIADAKKALEEARKVIDKYATNTSRLSAAAFNDLAIQNSPAYKNVSADDASEEAKEAKKKYDAAVEKLHKALTNKLDKDPDAQDTKIPDAKGDPTSKNYLDGIQKHANGEPLDRDVDAILKEMNAAAAELNKFATKTDALLKSVNEDAATHQNPAFKNASHPNYQKADGSGPDDDKNNAAKAAVEAYGKALNEAKDLLKDPAATQKDVDAALKTLNEKRAALNAYNTDTAKLKESVDKHGKEKQGDTAATEGTVTSDAYRNASDPHFMKEEGGKLVPDDDKNKKAAEDKKAYDEALTKAQELLKKHDDKDTPQDAKPTQQQINDALKTLDEKRQALDTYKTNADALKNEADLSKEDTEGASVDGKFENTPEFKNASYKQSVKPDTDPDVQQAKSDIDAYKKALKDARDLLAKKDAAKLSERPTQKQIDDALEALKNAKQAITDGYKTDTSKLNEAKVYANGDFKKTPEYENAAALKDDQEADQTKKDAAKQAVDALDENANDSALKKAKDIIDNPAGKTQKEVDEALKTLQDAMNKVTDNYKTDVKPLSNEVGDKDEHGKDVIPPFEASVPYKNALAKKDAESEEDAKKDTSATKKLEAYNKALTDAQELIAKHNDANTPQDAKPTQKQVDDALNALKEAKKAITDNFKTNAKDLKKETKELKDDGQPKDEKDQFEKSTEYQNALAKTDADSKKDVQTYKAALEKANKLLELFNDDGTPKADIPAGTQIPTQQEVDAAQKALEEIKAKILANYKTNPTELNEEVKLSKNGDDDTNPNAFEMTPAFRNAQAKGDDAANAKIAAYQEKLDAAKKLLEAFDLVNGGVKPKLPEGMDKAPTQKELDDALDALKQAKNAIDDNYKTDAQALKDEIDNGFTSTQPYQNVLASWGAADISKNPYVAEYLQALNAAKAVLDRHDNDGYDAKDKPTQKEVDDALAALKRAEKALSDAYNEPHAFLDPQTYGNTPSGGGAGGAAGANTGDAGNAGVHDANKQNEGAHANHNANHDTNTTDTTVHQPQHAAHNNANADANANAAANANVAADALGTGTAQAPDGSKASKDTNSNNARLPKTSDALPLYANSAAVLVAIAVLTRTNRRRKKNRL